MITIANANALHILLSDRSVQCVVTSPPYYGLRDYGTAKWEGGSAECDHSPANTPMRRGIASSTLGGGKETTGHQQEGYTRTCPRCGARRIDAQIGLESTPAAYVASIVAVMRECWRVLKDDGVLWLNLGDSYAAGKSGRGDQDRNSRNTDGRNTDNASDTGSPFFAQRKAPEGFKPKDLIGIPWRVAFALQDDGWYLRQDIIWAKPNPMPESVTDRCTKAHEYVFLLTKQARYFFDNDAIREPPTGRTDQITSFGKPPDRNDNGRSYQLTGNIGANRRSVWTVATSPYSGAHFATFPPALIEPMILAGTSQRGECPHCGKAWVRVVKKNASLESGRLSLGYGVSTDAGGNTTNGHNGSTLHHDIESVTVGWRQQCTCPPHEPIPQTVLDPFAGSGTTGAVAVKHGRRAVLLDLNTKYIDLQFERTNGVQMMFETIAPNSPSSDVAR